MQLRNRTLWGATALACAIMLTGRTRAATAYGGGAGGGWIATARGPAGIALLAVAAAGLLGRRRPGRRARCLACAAVAVVACAAPAPAVVSSTGGPNPPYTGLDINRHVGADRFYSNGYTGTRAIVANIESGLVWNEHESLGHVTTRITHPTLPAPHGDFDRHATSVAGVIGGRPGGARQGQWQRGIAYSGELWSGAIATGWDGAPYSYSFRGTPEGHRHPYYTAMIAGVNGRTADVVNASYGGTAFRDNRQPVPRAIDAMVNLSGKTVVVSAGNEGETGNPRPGPLPSTFNTITVGALASPLYSGRAGLSSHGPNDFWNPATLGVVPSVVASVDLMAPGTDITVALYGGATGGNSGGPVQLGANLYTTWSGTSMAAPIVVGGAALVVDAGKALFPDNPLAVDGRVVKSVLQNSATKLPGWYNAPTRQDNVLTTTQALDYHTGAGALNLDRAFTQYTAGITDLPGLGGGEVQPVGWDFGEVAQDEPNDYFFSAPLLRNSRLTATLNWFIDNGYDYATDTLVDQSLDNLDLEQPSGVVASLAPLSLCLQV